ncbi:MAG: hypothetical protein AB1899_06045 [Pseudomonadota bacterium]
MDKSQLKRAEAIANLAMLATALVLLYFAFQAESLVGGVFALAGSGLVRALTFYMACNTLVPDITKHVGETSYIAEGDSSKPVTPVKRTDGPEINEYIESYRRSKEALGKIIGLIGFIALIAAAFWIFK